MRPITVTAGPIAPNPGVATAVGSSAPTSPTPVQLNLTGAPVGGSNTNTWAGTASITGNVLTVATNANGAMALGRLSGNNLPPNLIVTGPGPSANQWYVSPTPQAPISLQAMRLNSVITFDAPRQVVIGANSDPAGANTYTIYGTNAAGQPIQETVVSTGNPSYPMQTIALFATVTQVVIGAGVGNLVSVGTSSVAYSPPVMFDPYVDVASIKKACVINGTPTYNVQISNDDPNSPTNPVPNSLMTWLADPDATFAGATTSLAGAWAFVPLWARLQLTSASPAGSSVTATFIQQGG